jgi:hypothetical protein
MNVEIPEAEAGHQAREAARQLVERLRAHKAEVRS